MRASKKTDIRCRSYAIMVKSQDIYLIVDGFHRYQVMMDHPDIYEREQGLLPVSVIEKPIDKRMASTVRHNRARGTHDVDLMSNSRKGTS